MHVCTSGRDVPIYEVFDHVKVEQMFGDMREHGLLHVEEVEELWRTDYSERCIISGFLKDASLGKKRLASMPDRISNTIHTKVAPHVPPHSFQPSALNPTPFLHPIPRPPYNLLPPPYIHRYTSSR